MDSCNRGEYVVAAFLGIEKAFDNVWCNIALYFILSRDVPILKSFSAGHPKIFACCSGGCSGG